MLFTVSVTVVCHNFWDIKNDTNAQLVEVRGRGRACRLASLQVCQKI
jgi:hypothetical protein